MAIDISWLTGATQLAKEMAGSNNPSTYATTFSTPQGDFTFISEDVINKGVKDDSNNYWLPWFQNKDNLKTLFNSSDLVDLSNVKASGITSKETWGTWVQDRLGQSPKGFLIPAGSVPYASKGIQSDSISRMGEITGLGQDSSGNLVYKTSGGHGNMYVTPTGEVHDPYVKRSGGLLGLVQDIGEVITDLGPVLPLALNFIQPGLGTAVSIGTALGSGNIQGAALGALGASVAPTISEAVGSAPLGSAITGTAIGLASGQPLEQALATGALNAGVNTVAAELANQTPADFEADINQALDTPASIPVSAFESDINQVLDMPATQAPSIFVDTTAPELPSGMDLAADIGPTANTVEDVSQALAGEGTAVSGQDLAADATPGNTLQDVSTALTPEVTPVEEKPGLSKEQIASLLKTGLGLFGGITAASKALGSSVPSINSILNTQSVVNAPTPFTGTYSGMNMTNPEYFQQVQQNYNRLFPNTPADVATPLQAWYSTEYKPETPVIKSLFGL